MKKHSGTGAAGGIWFFGFVGAVVYFIQQADSLWTGVIGFLKAIVWPAFLVYESMRFLEL